MVLYKKIPLDNTHRTSTAKASLLPFSKFDKRAQAVFQENKVRAGKTVKFAQHFAVGCIHNLPSLQMGQLTSFVFIQSFSL